MLSEALANLIERAAIEREWLYDDPESFRGGVQETMRALAVLLSNEDELLSVAG